MSLRGCLAPWPATLVASGMLSRVLTGSHAPILRSAGDLEPLVEGPPRDVPREKQSFAQAMRRTIPNLRFRVPHRQPKLISSNLGFVFTDAEVKKAAEDLQIALVLKFTSWRPPINMIGQNIIKTWGFMAIPTISFMDNHHFVTSG